MQETGPVIVFIKENKFVRPYAGMYSYLYIFIRNHWFAQGRIEPNQKNERNFFLY